MCKYEGRANFILDNCTEHYNGNLLLFNKDDVIKAMCQLAEEVEKEYTATIMYKRAIKAEHALSETLKKLRLVEYNCNNKHTKEVSEFNDVLKKELDLLYTKEQVEELLTKQRELCFEEHELISSSNNSELMLDEKSILNAKLEI